MNAFNLRSIFISVFILISLTLSYFSFYYVRDWGLADTQDYTSTQLLNTVISVRGALNKFHVLPSLISKQTDVQVLLLSPNPKHLVRVRNYLEQTNVIADSASILLLDRSGNEVAQSNWRNRQPTVMDNYANSDFFRKSIRGEQDGGVWFNERSGVRFYFSAPVYKLQKLTGVVVVKIDVVKALESTVTREHFYLMDSHDKLVYSSSSVLKSAPIDSSRISTEQENMRILLDGTQVKIIHRQGRSFLVRQVLLDDTQWSIGVITPLNVDETARWSSLGVFSGCLLLGLLMMYVREWRAKKRTQLEVVAAQLASEARGRHIINTTQSGLITLDERGNITFINPLVMQQFGISLSNVVNQPLGILFDQLASFTSLKRVLDNLADQTTSNFSPLTGYEAVAKRSDHSIFPALLSIKQMRTSPAAEYLVTLVDITKRKQLERSLKEVNESLEEKVSRRTIALENTQAELLKAEKMAVLGRMSTAIVHEINQPLTALRNYLAILERIKSQPELMDQPLDALNHLVDNMAAITRQLKMFAYAKNEPQEEVDMQALLEGVLVLVAPQMEQESVLISCEVTQALDHPAVILADRLRLEQVLQNLLGNAVDAMRDKAEKVIDIELTSHAEEVKITISDTGGGVEEGQLAHIFEPFYTTKEIGMGLGLGLSIVKNIVDDLEGGIRANNTCKGLMFTLSFPLIQSRKSNKP